MLAVKAGSVISNTLVPEFERSSERPEPTVIVPALLPGASDPSTASDLPLPEIVPTPARLTDEGNEYVPAVTPKRSNMPGLAVMPRFSPPVPIEPVPERAMVPPAIVVSPE